MVVGTAIQKLGSTPTPEHVDEYMQALGIHRYVVGTSLQGRNLVVYEFPLRQTTSKKENDIQNNNNNVPTVLFLSLVHGNEPMGLLSLLTTAHILAEGSARLRGSHAPMVRLLFFPIVNVDGYLRNMECAVGSHRGNMRDTSCERPHVTASACREVDEKKTDKAVLTGVDLNRNFPQDWNGTYSEDRASDTCASNYRGPLPFSEPETRAIRQVVQEYNVVAAMSFHSLSSSNRGKAMLIHPYTSKRPMSDMPVDDQARFRSWSKALNTNGLYKMGTASETIDYTAGGTTIDWLYGAHNITAFVFEVVPVCDNRWCPATPRLYRSARDYGNVGRRFVELVVHGRVVQDVDSIQRSIWFMLFVLVAWMTWTWKMPLWSFLRRRLYGKFKEVSLSETEMENLKS